MSDYELLLALISEYKNELKRRKDTKQTTIGENFFYEFPCNRERIKRLRLEIQKLMLRIERQMDGFTKETWY